MAYKRNVEIFEEAYEKKDAKSVVSYVARDGRRRYIAGNKNPDGGGNMPSGGGMTVVTWQELKDKRDNGELNPGSLYRITDYNCTTTQKDTQSAGHQFDIVLLALSANKLAEEGWAMIHDGVTEFDDYDIYNITFTDDVTKQFYLKQGTGGYNVVDVETFKGVREVSDSIFDVMPDIETKTATMVVSSEEFINEIATEDFPYNYFQNSNLSAWKVWYCLDNDTARFAWADDAETQQVFVSYWHTRDASKDIDGYYAWYHADDDSTVFTKTLEPTIGTAVYDPEEGTQEDTITNIKGFGRGVIYRLIDEWNNDVAYDFKNIQFVRPMTDGEYDADTGTNTWCYTFNYWEVNESLCKDNSIIANIYPNDEGSIFGCNNNLITIGLSYSVLGTGYGYYCLTNNVIFEDGADAGFAYGAAYISIINSFDNTIYCTGSANIVLKDASNCYINDQQTVHIEGSRGINIQNQCHVYYSESLVADDEGFYIYNKLVLTEE